MKQPKKETKQEQKQRKLRKSSVQKAMLSNLPLNEIEWMIQPIGITMLQGDLSTTQVNLLVKLMKRFQDSFKEQMRTKATEVQPTLFGDDGALAPVRIHFKELGISPTEYADLHIAAKSLIGQHIQHTTINEKGVKVQSYMPLFTRIDVPDEAGKNFKSGKRRLGYVEMKINPEVSKEALLMHGRYTKFLEAVTDNCRCKYSGRMYLFISSYRKEGIWKVDYVEFRKLLGFTIRDERTDSLTEVAYPNFSDVEKRVLQPSYKELLQMSEENLIDCYFEYEPVMPAGKKRGWPDKLIFHIKRTELGDRLSDYDNSISENIELERFLNKELRIAKAMCGKLTARLTPDTRTAFKKKMMELKTFIIDPKNSVKDYGGYSYTALSHLLDEITPSAEELVPDKKQTITNTQAPEKVRDLSGTAAETPLTSLSEEELERWFSILNTVRPKIDETLFNAWLVALCPVELTDKALVFGVPSNFFLEMIQQNYEPSLMKYIQGAYGEHIAVAYRSITSEHCDAWIKYCKEKCLTEP